MPVAEPQTVVDYKLYWLMEAGYSARNAERLAEDPDIDWHQAVALRQTCKESLCMKILWPRTYRRKVHE